MPVSIGTIAAVVATSVLKIVCAGALSAVAYRHMLRTGAFQSKTLLKDASVVNRDLLIPLFIFTRCARGISAELLLDLAFVPLLTLGFMLSGTLAGLLAAGMSSTPRPMWPIVVTVCTFSNVIGLPLPLLTSLIDGLYPDDPDAEARGASYLFLCNSVNSTLMWTFAPMLLSMSRGETPQSKMLDATAERSETATASDVTVSTTIGTRELETVAPAPATDGGSGSGRDSAAASQQHAGAPLARVARLAGRRTLGCARALNRPTWASILGVLVGISAPLRSLFIEPGAPLEWVLDSFDLLGVGAIPLITFVLGSTLSNGTGGGAGGAMTRRTTGAVLVAKLALVPAINLGLIVGASRAGLLPERGASRGLLPLALLVVGASPTAMNISIIATMHGTGSQEIALLLFYQYVIAIVSVSLFASVGLMIFL